MDVGLKINVLENRATILNLKHIYMPEKVEGNFFKHILAEAISSTVYSDRFILTLSFIKAGYRKYSPSPSSFLYCFVYLAEMRQ